MPNHRGKKRKLKCGTISETNGTGKIAKLTRSARMASGKDIKHCKRRRFRHFKQPKKNSLTEQEKQVNKPVVKTTATYSSTNPSSNWKNLMEILHIKENKKPKIPKKFPKVNSNNSKKVTEFKRPTDVAGETTNKPAFDIWFDDVDEELLQANGVHETTVPQTKPQKRTGESVLAKPGTFSGCTKTVAMDCEMVGVGEGGKENELARVSIVNRIGHCIYDKYVKPREEVVDYRTHVSGVRPFDLENAEEFSTVQKDVYNIIKGRILVGHAIQNDLKVLYLGHPKSKIRDTSKYKPFRALFNGRTPSLKKLTEKLLSVTVQSGEHNSVEDAQAAMRLYTMHRTVWEKDLKRDRKPPPKKEKEKVGGSSIERRT